MAEFYSASPPSRLETFLELLRLQKFTGSVILHFRGGEPLIAEYGRPNRVEFPPSVSSTPLTKP